MSHMHWTLITGGAKGLGAGLCVELARKGMPILVHYNSSHFEALQVVEICRSHSVSAECIQGDFSTVESVEIFIQRCHDKYPSIKNLINNVGNYVIKSAANTSSQEWNALFQTNLHAPFALCRALLPSIIQNQGSIINIGVVGAGNVTADTSSTAYRITKMGLYMLTKSLAKELASHGVRVNMVSPGHLENSVDLPADLKLLPMQRPASIGEVARVVAFLLDEDARYITGQNIEVAGGVRL